MEFENIIINTVEQKSFDFKNIEEINKFRFMTKTDQAIHFAKTIFNFVKIIDKTTLYYYNIKSKLWTINSKEQFDNFVYDFFNNSIKTIKKILKDSEVDDEIFKQTKTLCALFDKSAYIREIIDRSHSRLLDEKFVLNLDNSINFFPISNGRKIDFKKLQISERTKNDNFTYESDVNYIEGDIPNADKFFSQIMPNKEHREYLRKVLGYTLTADVSGRVFFIWYGNGSNGKSFIANLMQKLLKKQYHSCDKSVFIKKSNSSSGATPEIVDLMNKRMSVYSEGETGDNIDMNLAGIKGICGEDLLNARGLFKNPINFKPFTKLHMLTNFTPPTGADKAIVDRLRYIFLDSEFKTNPNPKTKNEFKLDKDFTDKIETIYLSEIFTWIARGAKVFFDTPNDKLVMPKLFSDRTNVILSSDDSIKSFIDRKIVITNNDKDYIGKKEIFEHYKAFCDANSQRCIVRSTFYNRLEHSKIKKSVLHGYDVFRAITIISDFDLVINEEENKPIDIFEPIITKIKPKTEDELLEEELENLINKK
jgi:P4 family phage/plasmid primase-like protien